MHTHSIFHQTGKARCRTPWAQMTGNDRVRTCPHCNTNVYRVSDLSEAEITRLIVDCEPASPSAGKKLWMRRDGTFTAHQAVCQPDYEQFGRWYLASIAFFVGAILILGIFVGKDNFYGILRLALSLFAMSAGMVMVGTNLFGEDGPVHVLGRRGRPIDASTIRFEKMIGLMFWQLPPAQREALAKKIYCMVFIAMNTGVCLFFYSAIPRMQRVIVVPVVIFGSWMLALHLWRWFMAQHESCCDAADEKRE